MRTQLTLVGGMVFCKFGGWILAPVCLTDPSMPLFRPRLYRCCALEDEESGTGTTEMLISFLDRVGTMKGHLEQEQYDIQSGPGSKVLVIVHNISEKRIPQSALGMGGGCWSDKMRRLLIAQLISHSNAPRKNWLVLSLGSDKIHAWDSGICEVYDRAGSDREPWRLLK